MLLFPLPFLTGFFLILVMIRLALSIGRSVPPLVLITAGFYALQSILLGIHWGFHSLPPILLASFSNVLPMLTWLTLNELSGRSGRGQQLAVLAAIVLVVGAVITCFQADLSHAVDVIEISVYALCGAHLLWLGWARKLEWNEMRPLDLALPTQRAFFLAGMLLLLSAGVDVMVAVDIRINDSRMSSAVVGYANLALLIILITLFFRFDGAGRDPAGDPAPLRASLPSHGQATMQQVATRPAPPPVPPSADLGPSPEEILDRLDAAMREDHLYRNESLSLSQIARHIKVPSRQVSGAVNSLRAMNVPQYVNTFRIHDACRMLEETETPVTEIVFAVGFTTKSNFNREFQRVTGLNPSGWRARSRSAPAPSPGGGRGAALLQAAPADHGA